jgi:transposase
MSTAAQKPATTPIPVQLSATEFTAFIFPHLSMPKRGPQCKLGYHRRFNLILWVLYTGMQWKCVPVPQDAHGKPAIHDTTVYRAFAKWAKDGALEQAFVASVGTGCKFCQSFEPLEIVGENGDMRGQCIRSVRTKQRGITRMPAPYATTASHHFADRTALV